MKELVLDAHARSRCCYIRLMSGSKFARFGDAESVRQLREVDLAAGRQVDATQLTLAAPVAVQVRPASRCAVVSASGL